MSKRNKNKKIPENKVKKDIAKSDTNVNDRNVIFSFDALDRHNKLFNMGDYENNPLSVEKGWFLDLLDCLTDVSKLKLKDFRKAGKYDLHHVSWDNTNIKRPEMYEQYDFYQFRINKSKGRLIGFFIENCFHILWLDRHHNLTNSEGYGGVVQYKIPKSLYELQDENLKLANEKCKRLMNENQKLKEMNKGDKYLGGME